MVFTDNIIIYKGNIKKPQKIGVSQKYLALPLPCRKSVY